MGDMKQQLNSRGSWAMVLIAVKRLLHQLGFGTLGSDGENKVAGRRRLTLKVGKEQVAFLVFRLVSHHQVRYLNYEGNTQI